MILRKLLFVVWFVTIIGHVPAQTCPAPTTDPLMKRWIVTEGDWLATWDPISAPVTRADGARVQRYRGSWSTCNGSITHFCDKQEEVHGTLTIAIKGTTVEIDRVETPNMRNTCHYEAGGFEPGTDHMSGFYTCNYHPSRLEWRAKIFTPMTSMYCDANEPRLSVPWHEQEGEWRGEWVPTATPGRYTANFRKGRETTQATMTIQIVEDPAHNRYMVKARRTQPLGTCNYDGTLKSAGGGASPADGWNVSGFYECSWGGGLLPWGAVIGEGHP